MTRVVARFCIGLAFFVVVLGVGCGLIFGAWLLWDNYGFGNNVLLALGLVGAGVYCLFGFHSIGKELWK